MSETDEIKLWCWVLGDTHKRIFEVSVNRSANVYAFKKAIQGQKPSFKNIPADSLDAGAHILTPGSSNCLLKISTKIVLKTLSLKTIGG